MSHTKEVIGAFIFLMTLGYLLIGRSKKQDPTETEDGKVRQMYPDQDDPEKRIGEYNFPPWRKIQQN